MKRIDRIDDAGNIREHLVSDETGRTLCGLALHNTQDAGKDEHSRNRACGSCARIEKRQAMRRAFDRLTHHPRDRQPRRPARPSACDEARSVEACDGDRFSIDPSWCVALEQYRAGVRVLAFRGLEWEGCAP